MIRYGYQLTAIPWIYFWMSTGVCCTAQQITGNSSTVVVSTTASTISGQQRQQQLSLSTTSLPPPVSMKKQIPDGNPGLELNEQSLSLFGAVSGWPSSAADFERPLSSIDLLALKVDKSLMVKLDQWLGKYGIELPNSLIQTIDNMDLCPEKAADGLRHYCTKIADGLYYDPWNPWCGYIQCREGLAVRQVCRPGTWMGNPFLILNGGSTAMDRMCRRQIDSRHICAELTDLNLCRSSNIMAAASMTTPSSSS